MLKGASSPENSSAPFKSAVAQAFHASLSTWHIYQAASAICGLCKIR
jgi:hypothetical protein